MNILYCGIPSTKQYLTFYLKILVSLKEIFLHHSLTYILKQQTFNWEREYYKHLFLEQDYDQNLK
jgi:hypothetical protein